MLKPEDSCLLLMAALCRHASVPQVDNLLLFQLVLREHSESWNYMEMFPREIWSTREVPWHRELSLDWLYQLMIHLHGSGLQLSWACVPLCWPGVTTRNRDGWLCEVVFLMLIGVLDPIDEPTRFLLHSHRHEVRT